MLLLFLGEGEGLPASRETHEWSAVVKGCVKTHPNRKRDPAAASLNVLVYAAAKEVKRTRVRAV
jgi:hypothetical protein